MSKAAEKDVEMKDAADAKDTEKTSSPAPKPQPLTPAEEIKSNITLIERAVSTLEPRFTHKVLRTLTQLRRRLDEKVLKEAIGDVYAKDGSVKKTLLSWLSSSDASMDVDSAAPRSPLPETEMYLRLLVHEPLLAKATALGRETVERLHALNRRSLDPIAAKAWFALGQAYELLGSLCDLRPLLLNAQRTASLRHDTESLATLINLVLRSYLLTSSYSAASTYLSKVTYPDSNSSPAQLARYLYYVGRIRAIELSYTAAHNHLLQAVRRAPKAEQAPGFWQEVHKWLVVVELLMGDIPERSTFRQPVLRKALEGYFEIVKAVRTGSLSQFQSTLSRYSTTFAADKTYTFILRLRQNVIKTGIRRLSLSYSRISLREICVKLHLDSEEDAEYIVGKAIRDGVIEGRVVHERGWMECGSGTKGAYGVEVSDAFNRRIGFCLQLHNESVKAMRYPLNAHRKELAAAEGAREREKELAKEIQEGELDDDEDMFE
ncbi:diphenol oxidase-A2 [Hysterangium stoloniferum]|nr:diphenol oxidase-A2 [Hysterangium stoloniferum]